MKKFLCLVCCLVLCLGCFSVNQPKLVRSEESKVFAEKTETALESVALATKSKSAILVEANTNKVLFKKNETERLSIASMTKMMSLNLVFDAIKSGKIKADEKIIISENAASTEGSQAFLDANKAYLVEDLIKTVIIASANDSTVALSEAVCGSEKEFVNQMNKKAQEMGLTNTHFSNSTGLSAPEHYSSAEDCAKIFTAIANNDIYNKYTKIWMDELVHPSGRKTELVNTNRLVKTFAGCDSGKTGYTSEAGYCLTCSATRNGVKLIAVVIGEPDSKTRFSEVSEMFNYGFSNYATKQVLNHQNFKTSVNVGGAKESSYDAIVLEDLYLFMKKGEEIKYKVSVEPTLVKAPLGANSVVGKVKILSETNEILAETNLVLKEDAKPKTLISSMKKIAENW